VVRTAGGGEDAHEVDVQPSDQHRPDEPVGMGTGTHTSMLTFLSAIVNKL
jgi:hypothetical protein